MKWEAEELKEKRTLAPFFVEADDLVDDEGVGEAAALGLADALGVVALVFAKEVKVQHLLLPAITGRRCRLLRVAVEFWGFVQRLREEVDDANSADPMVQKFF